jgi:hypothetical protein
MAASVRFRLSGGASNTSPAAALGGAMSTAAGGIITDNAANNVFDDVSGAESAAGDTEYRCIYVENNGDQTLQNAVLWIATLSANSDVDEAVGLDPAAIGSDSTTTIANENTAPAGVTFTQGTAIDSKAEGLAIGNIPAGSKKAFWIKRIVSAGAAAASWTPGFRVEGDSAA